VEGEEKEEEERRHCQTSLSHYSITHNHNRGTTQKWEHTWLRSSRCCFLVKCYACDDLRRSTNPRWGRTQGAVVAIWSLVRVADIHKRGSCWAVGTSTQESNRQKVKCPVIPRERTINMHCC
jgi:hypothetical protein